MLFSGMPPTSGQFDQKVETPSIRAFRGTEELTDPVAAIEAALSDPFSIAQGELGTLYRIGGTSQATFHRLYPPEHPGAGRYPTLRLEAPPLNGGGATEHLQLELELLAHAKPYEGLADLYGDFNLPVQGAAEDAQCTAEIILAPVAEVIPVSELKDNMLRVSVAAAPNVDRDEVRIGVKAFQRDLIRRFSIDGSKLEWQADGNVIRGDYTEKLADTPLALITLSYRGEFLHRWWLRDSSRSFNNRFEVHRAFDPEGLFRKSFFDQKNDFEERVALLLTVLGLTSFKYGQVAQMTDAPDIIAASSQGHLYVVECTTGDVNSRGKLQRLHDRAKSIRASLDNSPARPTAVVPIVFTSTPRSETAAHWAVAANLGIALVCREEIVELLGQLEAPPTPDQLYAAAASLIPSA
jgi:hypothetical protein